jgi:hypothetical protein
VIRDGLFAAIRGSWSKYLGGQFWPGWYWGPSYVSFFTDVCHLDIGDALAARARAYAGTVESACWWWPNREFVMVCERPTHIDRDDQGRLHSTTRKAIRWPDGWGLYRVHGIDVPGELIEHPESLTVARIDAEKNAEVRRVLIEMYGMGKYLQDSGADLVDQDVDPLGAPRRLWRRRWPDGRSILSVELHNSTLDADDTRRVYFVGVHPECRPMLGGGSLGEPQKLTALNAVASSYGKTGAQYRLQVET